MDWGRLLYLTHADRAAAAEAYVTHYTATSGQLYWSDLHQRSEYITGYHAALDRTSGRRPPGSEIITELYVPRDLAAFMTDAVEALRDGDPFVVYGTIRLVERDEEAVLRGRANRGHASSSTSIPPHDAGRPGELGRGFGLSSTSPANTAGASI